MSGLMACHECDAIQRWSALPEGGSAQCMRCGSILYKRRRNSLDRSLAFASAGMILLVLANAFPFLSLKIGAQVQEMALIPGIMELYKQDMQAVAIVVLLTTVLVPLLQLAGILYVVLAVKFGRLFPKFRRVLLLTNTLKPWSMLEVFMLGILVSIVKLAKMAQVIPGISVFAFFILIVVLAATLSSLDIHLIWQRYDHLRKGVQ